MLNAFFPALQRMECATHTNIQMCKKKTKLNNAKLNKILELYDMAVKQNRQLDRRTVTRLLSPQPTNPSYHTACQSAIQLRILIVIGMAIDRLLLLLLMSACLLTAPIAEMNDGRTDVACCCRLHSAAAIDVLLLCLIEMWRQWKHSTHIHTWRFAIVATTVAVAELF